MEYVSLVLNFQLHTLHRHIIEAHATWKSSTCFHGYGSLHVDL